MHKSRQWKEPERIERQVWAELEAITPTPRQLALLRALAAKHGTTFAEPVTRQQARKQILRLKQPTRRKHGGTLDPVTRSRWRPFPQVTSSTAPDSDAAHGR
jgi:hypothetical protein